MKINKAIIPAAGLGTRFLPYTKAIPKEMLPILEKPAIQLIVEEGLASGISEFNIIANNDKQAIKNHFSPDPALDQKLKAVGKESFLDSVNAVIKAAHFNYIPQPQPLGLGHAILQARDVIGDEYFGIFLPDEIMIGQTPALAQLIAVAQKYNASVIGVLEVPREKVSSYGMIGIKEQLEDSIFDVAHLIEKPPVDQAPSNFAIVGRYVLSPRIFDVLETLPAGTGGEIQLTDGIAAMMRNGERVIAYVIKTARYDVGTPLGWLQANIAIGAHHTKFGSAIKDFVIKVIANSPNSQDQ